MIRRPPRSTPFPDTTLFRSPRGHRRPGRVSRGVDELLVEVDVGPGQSQRLTAPHTSLHQHLEHSRVTAATGGTATPATRPDRKSTRLNSSHANISYAVFCLK